MIRSPLSVTMPGKTACPISFERGETSTSARPERALNSASSPRPAACSSRNARCMLHGKIGGLPGIAAKEERVARFDLRPGGAACRCPCPGPPSAQGRGRPPGRCRSGRCRHRAELSRTRSWKMPLARPYCSTSVLAWRLKSAGMVAPFRCGRRWRPNSTMMMPSSRRGAARRRGQIRRSRSRRPRHRCRLPRRGR